MQASKADTGDMAWWTYVQRHSAGAANSWIAQAVGVQPSSVGRWSKGSNPDPAQAAAFARAYGRPVLEAFIAAGFLTADEAGEKPSAAPSLASLSDDDLLEEVRRRMEGGKRWLDAGGAEEVSPNVTERRQVTLQARQTGDEEELDDDGEGYVI